MCKAARIPPVKPIQSPAAPVKRPAIKNDRVIKNGCAPVALIIAIYLRRSKLSITIADETLTEAARRIKNMMNIKRFFEV